MTIAISSTTDVWAYVVGHLRGRPERVAFIVGVVAHDTAGVVDVSDVLLVNDDEIEPGPWCVQLTDEAQQRVMTWASKRSGWLIEIHSHLGRWADPARLSDTDLEGLAEWVPHVRWRLKGRPYAALVVGAETLDGVAWAAAPGEAPMQVSGWTAGGQTRSATGLSLARLTGDDR